VAVSAYVRMLIVAMGGKAMRWDGLPDRLRRAVGQAHIASIAIARFSSRLQASSTAASKQSLKISSVIIRRINRSKSSVARVATFAVKAAMVIAVSMGCRCISAPLIKY